MGFVGDFVDDTVDVVVNVVEGVVGAVADAVKGVVKAVAEAIKDIVGEIVRAVKNTIEFIVENPILAIAIIVVGFFIVGPAIGAAWSSMSAMTSYSAAMGFTTLDVIAIGVSTFVETLAASWTAFATAIHFKSLMTVHSIATMVSADYRALMVNVYSQISVVSEALGYWPAFMTLAMTNTRNLVIDVSTSLGYSYDLAEVTWIGEMNRFLAHVAGMTHLYADKPEMLLLALQQGIEEKYGDTKAEYVRSLFLGVGAVITTTEVIVKDVAKINTDIKKLVDDLPTQLRGHWTEDIKNFIKPFDDFQVNVFAPTVKTLNGLLDTLGFEQTKTDKKLKGLVSRLSNPGDYIKEIDTFSSGERLRQESILADIASRPYHRDSEQMRQEYALTESRLKAVVSILEREIPLPAWYVPEIRKPIRPASVAAIPRATWFVGDY